MKKRTVNVGDFKIGDEEKKAIVEVLESGRISEGSKVRQFEEAFAEFIGTKAAVAVSSGTAALITGLTSLLYSKKFNIKRNSAVITTPLTYIATSNAIVVTGFKPVFIDVNLDTFVIDTEKINEYIENIHDLGSVSLILPVHLMGYPSNMNEINKIARKYGLTVFEDSSQAHGTVYNDKKVGSLSSLAAFSFYIAHNIQAGEMGALVTDDPEIARLARKIKANGRVCDCLVCMRSKGKCPRSSQEFDPRFTHEYVGYNFKTMEFQAALGMTQLKRADWIIKKRQENVKYLNEGLEKLSTYLKLPEYNANVSYLAYPLVIKNPVAISRMKLERELEANGIETRPLFGCIPTQQPAFSYLKQKYENQLPNAEYLGANAFYIGCHQYLSQGDLDYIISVFKQILCN